MQNSFTAPKLLFSSVQSLSRVWLCDPMNRSMPGLPCPSQTPEVHSDSCPLSQWCHPAISSSVVPFSSCLQSLPASGSFPMSQPFAWGGQSTGVWALASILPKKSQGWSPSEWTGWISLQSKGLSRVFSNTTVQKHQFFGVTYLLFLLHPCLELQATTDIFNVSVILPLPDFHKVGITHHLFSLFKVASFTCVCAQLWPTLRHPIHSSMHLRLFSTFVIW